jgi:hypothetical protein
MRRGEDEVWCSGDQYEGVGGLMVLGGGGQSSETWKKVIKEGQEREDREEGEEVGDVKGNEAAIESFER